MAQTAATKDRFGSDQFPILFEDGRVRVYKNQTNEVFVEDVQSGATMRINSYGHGEGLQFTAVGDVRPTVINGIVGWHVSRR